MVSGIIARAEPLEIEAKDDRAALSTLSLYLLQKNDDVVEVGLLGIDLRVKFAKADPAVGDWIKIKRIGKAGNKVVFDVETKAAPKAATPVDGDDPAPF